jgi:DNA-binding YbaB/EbfC family protein
VVKSLKCDRGKKKSEVRQEGFPMEVGAIQQMLSRLGKLQEDWQRQVNSVTVEASAGAGMVTVKMNGQKQIVDVRIEQEVFANKDQEMLQDLIRAAVNEASRRVDEELANQMKGLAGSIPGIPGLKIPGLF